LALFYQHEGHGVELSHFVESGTVEFGKEGRVFRRFQVLPVDIFELVGDGLPTTLSFFSS
jgi:hypothetical protein